MPEKNEIDVSQRVAELIAQYPALGEQLRRQGVFCDECVAAHYDNLRQVAQMHGLDLQELVAGLKAALSQDPPA